MPNISQKATTHFEAAQLLYQHGYYRDAVSRAYYAMYTAVEDYVGFSLTGVWSHRGIRSAFAAKMVHSGIDRQEARALGQKFVEAFNARVDADYQRIPIPQDFADTILASSKAILDWIQKEMTT